MSNGVGEDFRVWKRHEFLLEGTSDMIFFFSNSGLVEECNSSVYEQLGFGRGEEIWIQDIFRSCIKVNNGQLVFQDDMFKRHYETIIYRKNQTCFEVEMRAAMLSEEDGQHGACRARSVTQKAETERKLSYIQENIEEVKKERDELVANVTHELRTPVNGVMGLAQTLLDTDLDASQRETVDLIGECCKNMIKIINNILDFSKLKSNKFTLEYREFSFSQMMNRLIRTNQPIIEAKGLRLVCNVSSDIPDAMVGDELRIMQVLNNLLSNAVKFTSVGQISISVIKSMDFPDEMELFFMVADSGIGISDEERVKLFKSFSQVDASITRRFGGTGLGLSIVKSLVEMMGGSVNVESEKGKGSTFSFSVKVKKVQTEGGTSPMKKEKLSFHVGDADEGAVDVNEIFKLGSAENLKEIAANMEKLVLCIEMENWERANTFADNIKQLVADDAMNLKRKAFRLQMTLRREDHANTIKEYDILKEAIEEWKNNHAAEM